MYTMSGIRICKANAPTALPTDHAVEILQTEPTWNYSQTIRTDTPKQRDLQHPSNQPPPRIHLRELSNHTMDAMISTSSNANPSTASDVRSCPISNNSGLYIQMLLMYWSKIWRKKIQFGVRPLLIVNVQLQGRFLWKKIAMEIA